MKYTAAVLALALHSSASAHPFSTDTYSLANAVQVGDSGVSVVVILEVPVPVVLDDVKRRIAEGTSKRKAVKEHDESRFEDMAKGLSLSINNTKTPVTWRPVEHPSNGKVAEGFFLYWVGAKVPASDLSADTLTITVQNVAYPDKKMVYTGIAEARPGWAVQSNSATEVLGVDVSTLGKTDTRAWTDDARLRTLTVTLAKTP